jgi:phosphoglycolate phosphatase
VTRRWDGVIFDLDGTLVDSLADIGHAMNAALAGAGLPTHPIAAYRTMVGEGADALVARAVGAAPIDRTALAAAYRAAYGARAHRSTTVYPGVDALLTTLDGEGVALAVLSNKPDDFTRALVAERFGAIRFRAVWGQRAGVPRKPDPTAALALAELLATAPARVAFVGDTAVDVTTARAAGMTAIGALWGFRDRAELQGAGADHVVATADELLVLLGAR